MEKLGVALSGGLDIWARVVLAFQRVAQWGALVVGGVSLAGLVVVTPLAVSLCLVNCEYAATVLARFARGEPVDQKIVLTLASFLPDGLVGRVLRSFSCSDWTVQGTLWPALALVIVSVYGAGVWSASAPKDPAQAEPLSARIARIRRACLDAGPPFNSSFNAVALLAGLGSTLAGMASVFGGGDARALQVAFAPALSGMMSVVGAVGFATCVNVLHDRWVSPLQSSVSSDVATRTNRVLAALEKNNTLNAQLVASVKSLIGAGELRCLLAAVNGTANRLEQVLAGQLDVSGELRSVLGLLRGLVQTIAGDATAIRAELSGTCELFRTQTGPLVQNQLGALLAAVQQIVSRADAPAALGQELKALVSLLPELLIILARADVAGRAAAVHQHGETLERALQRFDAARVSAASGDAEKPADPARRGGPDVRG